MITLTDRLEMKKHINDKGYVKFPRGLFRNLNDYNIFMVIENENYKKKIPFTDVDNFGIFFNIDDTIPKGSYTYRVYISSELETQNLYYGRELTVYD